jgi:hypothetical protein
MAILRQFLATSMDPMECDCQNTPVSVLHGSLIDMWCVAELIWTHISSSSDQNQSGIGTAHTPTMAILRQLLIYLQYGRVSYVCSPSASHGRCVGLISARVYCVITGRDSAWRTDRYDEAGGIFFVDRVPTSLMGSNTNLTPKMRMYSMMYPMVPKAFDLHWLITFMQRSNTQL